MGNLNGTLTEERDGETSRGTNGLLGGGNETIKAPFVEGKLLDGDTADTVGNNEGLGRNLLDSLDKSLEVENNTGRSINVGGSDDLVLLLGEGLGNLIERRNRADLTSNLGDLGTVLGKAVGEAVTEETSGEDKGIFAGLDKVGSNKIPANGAGTVNNVGLGVGVGRADNLAEERKGLAKGFNKGRGNVSLAKG